MITLLFREQFSTSNGSDGSTTTVTTDDDGKAMATFDFSVSLADTGTEYYWYCTNYDELDDMGKKQVKEPWQIH